MLIHIELDIRRANIKFITEVLEALEASKAFKVFEVNDINAINKDKSRFNSSDIEFFDLFYNNKSINIILTIKYI